MLTHDNNPADNHGSTPLHIAAQTGHLDIYKLIIDKVENKNPTDNDGTTSFHLTVQYNHSEICKLINNNVNPADNQGYTPRNQLARNLGV